jgi:hypothetical protein
MSELQFQRQVIQLAVLYNWAVFHCYDSRKSQGSGYPDLTLAHERRGLVVFAELKTNRGRLSEDQRRWLRILAAAHEHVYCWRPTDWDNIQALLTGEG